MEIVNLILGGGEDKVSSIPRERDMVAIEETIPQSGDFKGQKDVIVSGKRYIFDGVVEKGIAYMSDYTERFAKDRGLHLTTGGERSEALGSPRGGNVPEFDYLLTEDKPESPGKVFRHDRVSVIASREEYGDHESLTFQIWPDPSVIGDESYHELAATAAGVVDGSTHKRSFSFTD